MALLLLILGAWLLGPGLGNLGVLWVLAIITLPGLLATLVNGLRKPADLPWALHLRGVAGAGGRQLAQIFLTFVFLPYDAFISLDAIGRTLLRLLVARRRLLEWQTSGDSERATRADLTGFYVTMWFTPALALVTGVFLVATLPELVSGALPILGVWVIAPWIAWWISQPIVSLPPDLTREQVTFLGQTARQTWHFFETFVTALENWLPPDNFQEIPVPTIASRTSPTNIGLALLANLAARDFGYLSVGGLLRRTHDTLATLHRLERHRGHFYNWYDTRTLRPLLPLYVSSVDSGNLAGHLLTLGAGLRELPAERVFTGQGFAGLRDTVGVLKALAGESAALSLFTAEVARVPETLIGALAGLERAKGLAAQIRDSFAGREEELKEWSQTLHRNCEEQLEELRFVAPWLGLPALVANSKCEAPRRRPRVPSQIRDYSYRPPEPSKRSSPLWTADPPWGKSRSWINPLSPCWKRPGATRSWPVACGWPATVRARDCWPWRLWRRAVTNLRRPWISPFCLIRRGICLPLAAMSVSAAVIPASMTCWPRRRACAAMSPSRWGRCRRSIGSRWAGCWSRRGASRSWFRGVARCSSN